MANMALGYINHVDAGNGTILTASTQVTTLPVSLLQNASVGIKFRAEATSVYILLDMGEEKDIPVVALFGHNLTSNATYRVRISSADNTGATGDVYDSGTKSSGVNTTWKNLVEVLSATVSTGRYVRIDLEDSSLSFIDVGRMAVMDLWVPEVNINYGWEFGSTDLSKVTKSRGGQSYVDLGNSFRYTSFTLGWLSEAEARDTWQYIQHFIGTHSDVMFIFDLESSNIGRDTYWGLMQEQRAVSHPNVARYTKAVKIEERL